MSYAYIKAIIYGRHDLFFEKRAPRPHEVEEENNMATEERNSKFITWAEYSRYKREYWRIVAKFKVNLSSSFFLIVFMIVICL